jgi:lipid A 3-O-deacylase
MNIAFCRFFIFRKIIGAIFVVGCMPFFGSAPCQAFDSTSFEFGNGNKTQFVRVGTQRIWNSSQLRFGNLYVVGYWNITLAYWRGHQYRGIPDDIQNIWDIGATPVFRLARNNQTGPYVEAGIGAHILSAHYDNNGRQLSTNFQFGTHVGVGYVFRNNVDLGLKIEHISNAGIKEPNSGVNFLVLRVAYPF